MNATRRIELVAVAFLLGEPCCLLGAPQVDRAAPQQTPSAASSPADALSTTGQAQLRAVRDKGSLEELQWPNFSDYSAQIQKFYEKAGFALEWSRGGKPTQQALDLIGILQQAGNKGLDSKDYDAERWHARVKTLSAASSKDENALVNFDVAMTVSGMRYSSDLHLGKVDPRTLHTDFEPERNEYDLCDFLLKRVVPAANVGDAFAKLEPAYLGYQRTLQT